MPKLKTHRGAAKRFKRTGTGKIVRSKAFKHGLRRMLDFATAWLNFGPDAQRSRV